MKKYVVYHDKCTDGFGAALIAWKQFKDTAEYIPLSHYDKVPEFLPFSEIYLLDFCFDRETLIKLSYRRNIIILDHHISAFEDVKDLLNNPNFPNIKGNFNLKQSGVQMAWNYWHPNEKMPELLEYIQDRDLNLYKFSDTKKVISALMTYPKKFDIWEKLTLEQLRLEGDTILRVQNQIMEEMAEKSHWAIIDGHHVPVVNSTCFWSDITFLLLEKFPQAPFVAAYYSLDETRVKWSLRSRSNENIDVSKISQSYGGGGHKNSAGFTCEKNVISFSSNLIQKVA